MSPRISVIITAHNAARFLPQAIDSILSQTFDDFELVIVDDGSTDGTAHFLAGIDDTRVQVLTPGRIGRAGALNLAIDASRGEYLAILDADDLALPDRLKRQSAYLDAHAEIDVVGSRRTLLIDRAGLDRGMLDNGADSVAGIASALRRGDPPSVHSSVMMRRSFVDAAGGYDNSLVIGLDIDLLSKAVAAGSFANLTEPVSAHRRHDRQFYGANIRDLSLMTRYREKMRLQDRVLERLGEPRRFRWAPLWFAIRRRLPFGKKR